MPIIKFLSISNNWTPVEFLRNIARRFNMKDEDLNQIGIIHHDQLPNKRYHLRLSVNERKFVPKMIKHAKLTKDGSAYAIKIRNTTILFSEISYEEEKFKIEKIKTNSQVIWTKIMREETIFSVIVNLQNDVKTQFNYLSVKGNNCYVGFYNIHDAKKALSYFLKKYSGAKFANSTLYIEKVIGIIAAKSKKNQVKILTKKKVKKVKDNDQQAIVMQHTSSNSIASNNSFGMMMVQPNINASLPILSQNMTMQPVMINPGYQQSVLQSSIINNQLIPLNNMINPQFYGLNNNNFKIAFIPQNNLI